MSQSEVKKIETNWKKDTQSIISHHVQKQLTLLEARTDNQERKCCKGDVNAWWDKIVKNKQSVLSILCKRISCEDGEDAEIGLENSDERIGVRFDILLFS